ncbi:AraC family transcriptional regulator [Paraburkholderia sp. D15]|uniref:helix-turn-helix domain-containing protein n=1 Tax=Paraburkholderia sp. D15 TaxID=2880218 RepID=UPI00247A68C1|nr:AraC family transcriptional regulator [Paraburkholderia sp. D15]WGS52909.1 AraC family transcriptional regulator [Paraburkholderia sp. D15]WKF61669.1 Regulatory protein SoxS [Paraburkholderia busanensis]
MLRPFNQLCEPADKSLLVAADAGHATLTGSGTYAMPWHWHDCLMFILPSHGAVELRHEDRRAGTWLSQDRFAVVPSGRAHQTRAGCATHTHVAVYVTSDALHQLDTGVGSLSEFRRRTRTPILVRRTAAIRTLQELSLRNDMNGYGAMATRQALSSALLMQCIGEVIAGKTEPGTSPREHGMALVADLEAFVTRNADQEIPLDTLEARFGISRRHITRLFREGKGISIGEFQQRARYDNACRLLAETDLPIGEVAFRVGFESGAALARAMRRIGGHSPSELRDSMARSVKR